MPAAGNGKLYAAVSAHVVAEALAKLGFEIERKRIDIPGNVIKSVGHYKATIKLYEAQTAEITITVIAETSDGTTVEAPKTEAAPAKEEKAE